MASKTPRLQRASRIEAEELLFVAPGIPEKRITVVSGRPGEGKTTWAIDLAARVSQSASVICSFHEDTHTAVRMRLEAAGAKLKRCFIPPSPFVFPQDAGPFAKRVKETRAALAIFDSA